MRIPDYSRPWWERFNESQRMGLPNEIPELQSAFIRVEGMKFLVANPDFSCPVCHKVLASRQGLQRHYRIHTGLKPFVCSCSKAFPEANKLTVHRRRCLTYQCM